MKQKIFIIQRDTQTFIYVFREGSFKSPKIYINLIYIIVIYYFNKFLNKYEIIYEKKFYEIIFPNVIILFSIFII